MAVAEGAITEDSDLTPIMTANDIGRMTPQGGSTDAWHVKAWVDTLLRLKKRPTPVLEGNIADTAQLIPAVIHDVAKQMFAFGRALDMAEHHRTEYLRQLNMIDVRVNDADSTDTTDSSSFGGSFELEMG